MATDRPTLPPVTDGHRRQAFELLRLTGWTYTGAMGDELRRRIIEAVASDIRTRQWKEAHAQTQRLVRRLNPQTGAWCTQRVAGAYDARQPALVPPASAARLPATPAYAISALRCALRTCSNALDALINAASQPAPQVDWGELEEILGMARDILEETDAVAMGVADT